MASIRHRLLRHPSRDDPPPAKRARVEVDGRLGNSDPDARVRALAHWASLKTYVRSAVGGLRTLLFIHSADTRVCLRLRGLLNRRYWTLAFFALQMQRSMPTKSLKVLTEELEGLARCFPSTKNEKKGKQVDESPIKRVFAALLVYLYCAVGTSWRDAPIPAAEEGAAYEHASLDASAAVTAVPCIINQASKTRKKTSTKPAPLPKEVLDALDEKNQLARQLVALQDQGRVDQEARERQRQQLENQQAQMSSRVL